MMASGLYRKIADGQTKPHERTADNICCAYLYLAENFGYKLPIPLPSPSFFAGLPSMNKELSSWRSSLLFLLVPRDV